MQNSNSLMDLRHLKRGIESGAANQNNDDSVAVVEGQDLAKQDVWDMSPIGPLELDPIKETAKTHYRQAVEYVASRGVISKTARETLEAQRQQLGLTSEEAGAIETEVLQPYRQRQQNLAVYEQYIIEAFRREAPLSQQTLNALKTIQQALGLQDEDISPVIAKVVATVDFTAVRASASPAPTPIPTDTPPAATAAATTTTTLAKTTLAQPAITVVEPPTEAEPTEQTAPVLRGESRESRRSPSFGPILAVGITVLISALVGGTVVWRGYAKPMVKPLLYFETLVPTIDRWQTEWTTNTRSLQEIDRLLNTADDLQTAREEAEKITFSSWKRQAYATIGRKKRQIDEQERLKSEQLIKRLRSSGQNGTLLPAEKTCFQVIQAGGAEVRKDNDPINDGVVGESVGKVPSGTVIVSEFAAQKAWSPDGHELIEWINIKEPIAGWVPKTQVTKVTCASALADAINKSTRSSKN